MGTFSGLIIEDLTRVNSSPIWGDAIGIIIGCLLGVAIPKLIMGSSSETHGMNKCSSNAAFLGDLDEDQLVALIEGKNTVLEFRSNCSFSKLDADNSGCLDLEEIKSYLKKSLGDDYQEEMFNEYIKSFFDFDLDGNTKEFTHEEFRKI